MSKVIVTGCMPAPTTFGELEVGDWFIPEYGTLSIKFVYNSEDPSPFRGVDIKGQVLNYGNKYKVYKVDADIAVRLAQEEKV